MRLRDGVAGALLLWGSAATAAPAPDFALADTAGRQVSLSSLRGQVVLVAFWATWCGPCKEELPHLQQLYAAHRDEGFTVLAVSTDDARTAGRVASYVARMGYTFPVLLDRDAAVVSAYDPAKTLPHAVLIGRDGEVIRRTMGYQPGDEAALAAAVVEALTGS
ncbi:MAG: TlpA disulfide reductase family protein [Myxococcota bacterium]